MRVERITDEETVPMPEMAPASWAWASVYGILMLCGGVIGYLLRQRYFPGMGEWAIGLSVGVFIGVSLVAARLWFSLRQASRSETHRGA